MTAPPRDAMPNAPRDEATVAREALQWVVYDAFGVERVRLAPGVSWVNAIDEARAQDGAYQDRAPHFMRAVRSLPAPQPPTRKVRAEVDGYELNGDAVRRVDSGWFVMHRDSLRNVAALDARADADGMVEEGLGHAVDVCGCAEERAEPTVTSPAPTPTPYIRLDQKAIDDMRAMGLISYTAPQSPGNAPPSDDPPASRVEGRPDAPSPQAGDGEDGRDGDRVVSIVEEAMGTNGYDSDRALMDVARDCVDLESELARVRKEREDEREAKEIYRQAMFNKSDALIARLREGEALRTQLAAMTRERDDWQANAQRENAEYERMRKLRDGLQAQLDAATKRIEEGDECWHFTSPSRDAYYPYNVSSSDPLGRCVRGRFVPDQEGAQ